MMRKTKRRFINIIAMVLIFSAALLALPTSAQAATAYTDIQRHWAGDVIERWESLGVLKDFPAGRFYPDNPISRAQFFSLLVRALGATQTADIAHFTDVPQDAWYYDIVAKANKMRIAEGSSENSMKPTESITRQDAATLVARAMGLLNENDNYLYRYDDSEAVSNYARNFVSAVTAHGYMMGSNNNFRPTASLNRSEAVKIIDNLFKHYYRPEVGFDNFTLTGNVLSTRSESVFNDLTLNGDLILGDGVGQGNATLNNCTINGRLLVRGGGPNSIVLNNTYIADGITIISPSSTPRIITSGSTTAPQLTAFSTFALRGTGVHSLYLVDDAFAKAKATLQGVMLETVYLGGVNPTMELTEGRIVNLHVGGAADTATLTLAKNTQVDHFSTFSPNTSLSGAGTVADAFISAPGAVLGLTPAAYSVGANLTATIGGQTVSGKSLDTANNVSRSSNYLNVTQDSDHTGGENLHVSNTPGRSANTVLVTQKPYDEISLENINSRWGYYIGFFIPAPASNSDRNIEMLTYVASDGGLVIMENVPLTRRGGIYGLEFHVPVRRDNQKWYGQLSEMMYIQWNGQVSENLQFHSGRLNLEPLTNSQEDRLVDQYMDNVFYGYDGTRYTGEEALQRLLASDNPLGLNVQGFANFAEEDQTDLAARFYELSDTFDSKESIQDKLNKVITGKAALYAINNAVTVEQIRNAVENAAFAKELNIESGAGSNYHNLAVTGKERVARTLLFGRTKEYANAAAIKTAFDKAVSDARNTEISLLVAINNAKTAAEVQRLIEIKTNADTLSFAPGEEPYKSCPADLKLDLGKRILDNKPYYTLDPVAQFIHDFLANLEESGLIPTYTVNSITVAPTTMTLGVGMSAPFTVTLNTTEGAVDGMGMVNITSSNATIAEVDAASGVIYGRAVGSATISIVSISDAKKTATIKVTVKEPVPSTGIKLNKSYVEIEEGSSNTVLIATMTPTNSTDMLTWSSEDPGVVSVDDKGRLTGVSPGFATVTVRTTSNYMASCTVVVTSKTPGVMVNPTTATIGPGQSITLTAVVSPISLSNRTVSWSTSHDSVATVDPYGKVTGVADGTATITAISNYDNSLSATCVVTVDSTIRRMTLNKTKIVMVPNGIEQLTAAVTPPDSSDVIKWGSRLPTPGDPDTIATVSADGLVTAVAPGIMYVYAYVEGQPNIVTECLVEVLNTTLKVAVTPTAMSVGVGTSADSGIPVFTPNTITNKTINWSIAPVGVASLVVNNNGSITATGIKNGTATITGKPQADPNITLTIKLTVSDVPVTAFTISPSTIQMEVGNEVMVTDVFSMTVTPVNATNKTIEWVSSGTQYLTISNNPGTEANPYGASYIKAIASTHTLVDRTPVGEPAGSVMVWEGTPVTLTAKMGNISRTVYVEVYPNDASQVTNIKIAASRWVYEVGSTLPPFTTHFNVTGRDATTYDWMAGNKPPNVQVIWSSSNPNVAEFNASHQLITKTPGITQITATTANSNATDSITIIVAPPAVDRLSFSGLDAGTDYGKVVQMTVGEQRLVTPIVYPNTSYEVNMDWQPNLWAYTDPDNDDRSGTATSSSTVWTMLDIDSTNNNMLKALKSALILIKVVPENNFKYAANISLNSLWTLCNSIDSSGDLFDDCLKENKITKHADGKFYTPNEHPLLFGTYPSSTGKPINPDEGLNLLIPNSIAEGSNEFFVWITGKKLNSVNFLPASPVTAAPGETITLTAKVDPDVLVNNTLTLWEYDSSILVQVGAPSYNAATGIFTTQFMVVDPLPVGKDKVDVKLTVTSQEEYGVKSTATPAKPRQKVGGDVVSATHSVNIAAIVPGFAPIMAPVATGAEPAAATVPEYVPEVMPQPEPEPIIQATAALQPQPAGLPSVETAKTLALRGAAAVVLGESVSLVPFATPAIYDYSAITWSSSKPDIATVDAWGTVTGLKAGKAVITATVPGTKLKRNCTVSVHAAPKIRVEGLTLNNSDLTLEEGKAATLRATVAPAKATLKGITWFSSDISVAKVDISGRVTAVAAGSAVISAVTDDGGYVASCYVSVTPKPIRVTGVTLEPKTLTMTVGEQMGLTHTVLPFDATNQNVTWTTSNKNVLSVDGGQITALKKGTATITVTTADGKKKATCKITVK